MNSKLLDLTADTGYGPSGKKGTWCKFTFETTTVTICSRTWFEAPSRISSMRVTKTRSAYSVSCLRQEKTTKFATSSRVSTWRPSILACSSTITTSTAPKLFVKVLFEPAQDIMTLLNLLSVPIVFTDCLYHTCHLSSTKVYFFKLNKY